MCLCMSLMGICFLNISRIHILDTDLWFYYVKIKNFWECKILNLSHMYMLKENVSFISATLTLTLKFPGYQSCLRSQSSSTCEVTFSTNFRQFSVSLSSIHFLPQALSPVFSSFLLSFTDSSSEYFWHFYVVLTGPSGSAHFWSLFSRLGDGGGRSEGYQRLMLSSITFILLLSPPGD